jgi:hypothetical protein
MIPANARLIRALGREFYGARYVTPMAKDLGTTANTLRRWSRTGGPKDMLRRLEKLSRVHVERGLLHAAAAAEILVETAVQANFDDSDRVHRLKRLIFDLYPAPPPKPERTVDEILAGDHPIIAAFLRPIFEGVEG